jgi:hypothetical protein
MRVPRITGLPLQTSGLIEMRSDMPLHYHNRLRIQERKRRHRRSLALALRQIWDCHPNPSDSCPISARCLSAHCLAPSKRTAHSSREGATDSLIRRPRPASCLVAVCKKTLAFRDWLLASSEVRRNL